MSLYSERFLIASTAGPVGYTCPPGYRAIVKFLSAYNGSAGSGQALARIGSISFWVRNTPANTGFFDTGLHIPFYAGERLEMLASPSHQLCAAGYVLRESAAALAGEVFEELEVPYGPVVPGVVDEAAP